MYDIKEAIERDAKGSMKYWEQMKIYQQLYDQSMFSISMLLEKELNSNKRLLLLL